MKIAVIGMGYVGLTPAAALAHIGHEIFGVEIDEGKLELLKNGKPPIFQEFLDGMLNHNRNAGRLHFTSNLAESPGRIQYAGETPALQFRVALTSVNMGSRPQQMSRSLSVSSRGVHSLTVVARLLDLRVPRPQPSQALGVFQCRLNSRDVFAWMQLIGYLYVSCKRGDCRAWGNIPGRKK